MTDSEDADIALSIVGFVLAAVPVFTIVISPVKSVVQIHFPTRNMTLAYFNDKFDLRRGDLVYVDGKLEGLRGRIVDVAYNFKITLSKYQRVIAVVDTEVHGIFHLAGSHFVTFDRDALPQAKVRTWYKAPDAEDDEYVSGSSDEDAGAGIAAVRAANYRKPIRRDKAVAGQLRRTHPERRHHERR